MKLTSLLGASLAALVLSVVACSSSDSGNDNGGGSRTDGGTDPGADGGHVGPGGDDGGTNPGDDGGAQTKDGGDGGSMASGASFTVPVAGDDNFGSVIAITPDGATLVIGAQTEAGGSSGIGGNQSDTSKPGSGAVFVYAKTAGGYALQAYVKASNPGNGAHFGNGVALANDGNTLLVGATGEQSNATGVGGNQADTSVAQAGAAYVFTRTGTTWTQQAYLKASNTQVQAQFGWRVALSGDGTTAVVGSPGESGASNGINGTQTPDNNYGSSGAAYVFTRSGATWSQQAYVKASNPNSNAVFGNAVALSADGNTMAIGSPQEFSNATGINGNGADTSLAYAGAVYTFARSGTTWTQQAYVKASNTKDYEYLGCAIALSSDGNTLVAGSYGENSNSTVINGGNPADTSVTEAGAAFVFTRSGTTWSQQAYLKASDTAANSQLGWSVAISTSGDSVLVGAPKFSSQKGAGYNFTRSGTTWTQKPRLGTILAPTGKNELFGYSVALASSPVTNAVGVLGLETIETF